jgi:polysaccharide pyruvyl transferase WcaK-like protein
MNESNYMVGYRVHLIHVGNMKNKGTQALLKSDIQTIKKISSKEVFFSVSTTDVKGTSRLNPSISAVLPPLVDIPYEKADYYSKKFGFNRDSPTYKVFSLGCLLSMFLQILISTFFSCLVKLGLSSVYRNKLFKHLTRSDVVISYSDENFKESASFLPFNFYWMITWWSMIIARTWEILIAKFLKKPIIMFPNTVGPFQTIIGKFLTKLALNCCQNVILRDPTSYELVKSLKIHPCLFLTSDTALLFETSADRTHRLLNIHQPVIGVSPGIYSYAFSKKNLQNYIKTHAEVLDRFIDEEGVKIIFLPHNISEFDYDDLHICKLISQKMKNKKHTKILRLNNAEEFKDYIKQMDMMISSKMHPAVFAVSNKIPTLCLAYDYKQTGLFEQLNMNEYVINVSDVSYENLLLIITKVWNNRLIIKKSLEEKIPLLKKDIMNVITHVLNPVLINNER